MSSCNPGSVLSSTSTRISRWMLCASSPLHTWGLSYGLFLTSLLSCVLCSELQPLVWLFTDPPRAGLDAPVIEYLKSCSASTLIYVSCDPATQARDLQKLCDVRNDGPFELQYVQPVDMFPQTHHIEMVALLRRR